MLNLLLLFDFDTERNWSMTLPGFGGDEIKSYRKPVRVIIDWLPLSRWQYGISTLYTGCGDDAFHT